MARILVVEDHPLHAERMESHLENLGHEILAIDDNAFDALAHSKQMEPDLVLLDIHLSGEPDGIKTAEKIKSISHCPIIFTTSLTDQETLIRAGKTQPDSYLIKPIDEHSLNAAIQMALARRDSGQSFELQTSDGPASSKTERITDGIFIKVGRMLKKIPFDQVEFISAGSDKYSDIQCTNGQSYSVRSTLNELLLALPPHFLRVHRGHIVNLQMVLRIDEPKGLLKFGTGEVPLGKSYKQDLYARLNKVG